jgi:hypothetical protein
VEGLQRERNAFFDQKRVLCANSHLRRHIGLIHNVDVRFPGDVIQLFQEQPFREDLELCLLRYHFSHAQRLKGRRGDCATAALRMRKEYLDFALCPEDQVGLDFVQR